MPSAPVLALRGAGDGLLDEPFALEPRGFPAGAALRWRARLRDDDGRVWRATASDPESLHRSWAPAKPPPGPLAALGSLRPVSVEVRVEAPDGAAVSRVVARAVLGDGVKVRRWRDVGATLVLPAGAGRPPSTVVIDATAGAGVDGAPLVAAALLASRGVLVLLLGAARRPPAEALERLAAVPGAHEAPLVVRAGEDELPVPPGVPHAAATPGDAAARETAWDALLARAGARRR